MSEQAPQQGSMQTAETAFANLLSGKEAEPEPEVEATEEVLEEEQTEAVDPLTAEEEESSEEEISE